MKQPKPEPVVTATVCSLCGLDWDAHGDNPTPVKCIELLCAELARRPRLTSTFNTTGNVSPIWLYNTSSPTTGTVERDDPPDDAVPAAL